MKVIISSQFLYCCFLLLFLWFSGFVGSFNEEEQEDIKRSQFPENFFFGTATSSYQIEGAFLEDGKSLSNWDVFTHRHGAINNGENGDVAEDHYHRYLEDIELVHSLGVNAYRFSISWSRVLPRGRFGEVNPNGVMFYNNIIDNLLVKGIQPFVTIAHHDFPQELEDRYGSWLSPFRQYVLFGSHTFLGQRIIAVPMTKTVNSHRHNMKEEFVHYAETCFKSFGDRVKNWLTINEPNLFADMAYIKGKYPPAHCSEPFGNCSVGNSDIEPLTVMHNMLLAHAKAVKIYRECFQKKHGGMIGIVGDALMYRPLTDDVKDREAASRVLAFNVAWVFDPLVYGDYPPEMRQYLGNELPTFSAEETEYIKNSIDFIGINHYSTLYVKDCIYSSCIDGGDRPIRGYAFITRERNGVPIGEPTGMAIFFIVPEGMVEIVDYIKKRYPNMPIFVFENGYAPPHEEDVQVRDLLHDVKRIEFHKAYLSSLARAIRDGADVRGYFIWTLMDDFEWIDGYNPGFGLHYVDHQTLERIPKLSAKWYKNFLTNYTHNNDNEVAGNSSLESKNVITAGLRTEHAEI